MRVNVYIDGFNLYYRALRGTDCKWLDPVLLAQSLLGPEEPIGRVRYFSARISPRAGNLNAPRRQQIYINALKTRPEISFHWGRFLTKTKRRPLVADPTRFVDVHDTEEKGSDVNLAAHLLHDGWRNEYDVALVMSQDTDLLEPLRMVRDDLGKTVGLVWLDGSQPSRRWRGCVSFIRQASRPRLRAAQFPPRLMGRDGHPISKPAEWD